MFERDHPYPVILVQSGCEYGFANWKPDGCLTDPESDIETRQAYFRNYAFNVSMSSQKGEITNPTRGESPFNCSPKLYPPGAARQRQPFLDQQDTVPHALGRQGTGNRQTISHPAQNVSSRGQAGIDR